MPTVQHPIKMINLWPIENYAFRYLVGVKESKRTILTTIFLRVTLRVLTLTISIKKGCPIKNIILEFE